MGFVKQATELLILNICIVITILKLYLLESHNLVPVFAVTKAVSPILLF
jgi:hypothetical protein